MPPKTIQFGKEPKGATPKTLPFGGNLRQSMGTLSSSQMLTDRLREQAKQAEIQAQQAASVGTITKETAKGTASTLLDTGLKFLGSAVKAPVDIASQMFGGGPDTRAVIPGISGPQKSIQGEFASETIPQVMSGERTPLSGTLKPLAETAIGAADVGGASGLAAGIKGGIIKPAMSFVGKLLTQRAERKGLESAISAVDPNLSGKKLAEAYKKVGTGARSAKPQSLLGEQALEPDEQTIRLGTRLKDVLKGKSSLENLENVAGAFKKTEDELGTLLKGDPSLVYNADKPTLAMKLEELKTTAPQEFMAIKESKSMYDTVVNFGNRVLKEAEDTPFGIREARKSFDERAKKEFPSAFKDGKIDDKTPAGRAIKTVRDAFNEHLYATAPEGSKIKDLILYESDLFKAIERIAPDAAKKEGLSKLREVLKRHPYLYGTLTGIFGAGAVNELLR